MSIKQLVMFSNKNVNILLNIRKNKTIFWGIQGAFLDFILQQLPKPWHENQKSNQPAGYYGMNAVK